MNMSYEKYFKGSFILLILFIIFFAVNLYMTINNKPISAYDALLKNKDNIENKTKDIKLTDTRAHSWEGLKK